MLPTAGDVETRHISIYEGQPGNTCKVKTDEVTVYVVNKKIIGKPKEKNCTIKSNLHYRFI
jgi:hypothetical protein